MALLPKREFENLCAVYKSNCGKVGLLPTALASEIVAFYAHALSLPPKDPEGNGSLYDVKNVAACVKAGRSVQSVLEGLELQNARDSRKQ